MRSKCGKSGHYSNTCYNPRADFDDDYPGDVVSAENLLAGNYPSSAGVEDMNTIQAFVHFRYLHFGAINSVSVA